MEPDSFSISLQSNRQTDRFTDNTNYEFRNTLPVNINCKNYRVGLESIFFHDYYEKPIYQPHFLEEKPKAKTSFYDTFSMDNKVTVQSHQGGQLAVIKFTDRLDTFIIQLNLVLERQKYPIHVSTERDGTQILGIVLNNTAFEHVNYLMDKDLARVFGFSTTVVPRGISKSDLEFNINLFNGYEKNSTLGYFEFFIFRQLELELPQLDERPRLSELLVYITSLLNSHNFDVSMTQVHNRDAIEYEIKPYYIHVYFSKFLLNYLGLPETFSFKGKGTVPVRAGLEEFDEIKTLDFDYTTATSSKLFICCDIIDENYYAGVPLPYLAIVDRQNIKNDQVAYRPERIIYKQVNCDRPNQLCISIKTDQNDFLALSKYPSTINLHFKRNTLA